LHVRADVILKFSLKKPQSPKDEGKGGGVVKCSWKNPHGWSKKNIHSFSQNPSNILYFFHNYSSYLPQLKTLHGHISGKRAALVEQEGGRS